jgi:hypothetical protein
MNLRKVGVYFLIILMIASIVQHINLAESESHGEGTIMWYGWGSRIICVQLNADGQSATFTESFLVQENGDPMPQDTFTSLTQLENGSIIWASIIGDERPFESRLYYIEDPKCDGSTSTAKFLGIMPDQIGIEGLYTDASDRIYVMDTGLQVSSSDENRLLRFTAEVLSGDFNYEVVTDLTDSVPDIDDLGPGIDKINGTVVDTPGFAIDTYDVYDVDYETGDFSYVGLSEGVWGIHAINGSYFTDSKSRLYVISGIPQLGEIISTLYEIDPDTGATLRVLGSGPSGTGLTGPLPPGISKFSNLNPVANAGADQIVNEGDLVHFNGSLSYDPDGTIESYEWDMDSNVDSDGDGNTLNDKDKTGPLPTHIYGDNGIFLATLKVTDNQGFTDTDSCNITVQNVNPQLTLESPNMDVQISLRVAGSKWSNVGITLYEEDMEIGYLEVERWPGNPDDNPTYENPSFPTSLNLTKSYKAIVTYDPYPDSGDEIRGDQPNNGKDRHDNAGNPVWVTVEFPDGSQERIHHTFNTQQSMKRNSDHWNHVEPWEVNIMSLLVGHSFEVSAHVTDPGSDDETITYIYGSQTLSIIYHNNPPNLDPYPSPEINPRGIIDNTQIIYEGSKILTVYVEDDDGGISSQNMGLS